ncbi:hypothetical protein BH09PLA1_BH09PLA1_03600 [soil metagenome]
MIGQLALIVLAIGSLSLAQAPPADPATATNTSGKSRFNEAGFIVTRMDVANAFLSLEKALNERPMPDDQRARVHREFDRITGLFFLLKYSAAVQGLNELTDSIARPAATSIEAKLARALRVRLASAVAQTDQRIGLRIKISPMYSIAMEKPAHLKLEITREGERLPVLQQDFTVETNGLTPVMTMRQPTGEAGKYRVEIVAPNGFRSFAAMWFVADRPMELLRTFNEKRLRATAQSGEAMAQARVAVDARNALLSDRPSETDAARFFANQSRLASELDFEIGEIEAGSDPFVNRAGDYWRAIYLGDVPVPVRIYVPQRVIDDGKPAPLVIVLHGASGDEGMFFEAYGLGEIKRQADQHGFIVVSPRVDIVKRAADPVNAIVKALSFDYSIDPKRVYAIGHSTGALLAQSWAYSSGGGLAAVVQFSGAAEFTGAQDRPPTLLIGGELDLIFPPDRLQAFADKAKQRGLRVEFRQIKDSGHTLIVGEKLPNAIDWLMSIK